MEIPQQCPAAGVGDEVFRKKLFSGHLQQQQPVPQECWELPGSLGSFGRAGSGRGPGFCPSSRGQELLEGLDVVCAC